MAGESREALRLELKVRVSRASGARPDRRMLRGVCGAVLEREGVSGAVRLTLHLVDDAAIANLNASHRGIDRPTDVLSFPLQAAAEGDRFVLPPGEPLELGDIVISYPRTLAQAEAFGHSPRRELGYLTAHGLLHILGHDHQQPDERARMREREEAALGSIGLGR